MNPWLLNGLVSAGVVATFVLARRFGRPLAHIPLFSPVVTAALAVTAILALTATPVERFEQLASPLRWTLGPAIVALGAVVHTARLALRAQGAALLVAIAGGTAIGLGSAVLLARAVGLGDLLTAATATRTLSTPFAILIQTRVGGPVPLAAALAVLTGVIGAILLPPLLKSLRLRGSATVGTALGVAAHIVGTDSIARRDAAAGAFAGAAMVLTGIVAALALPLLWAWLTG